MDKKELQTEISELKAKLIVLYNQSKALCSNEIVIVSQELDYKLNKLTKLR
ncbi:Spo0E family sporulation regulatory protein-aspartic acid phosphatase (plasmid) [Alkalihalophilus sp. As8PL]|uniref:Spo0E family sporulation regulatory protein-aspartic acid phosphatase n=1 Tax=Alkalihalophilus sp. As8PL TaxID=3237103 RepID=A0AB39BN75_9BACI